MDIKFFNEDYNLSPAQYAKVLFENTVDDCLTLSRRYEDPLEDDYDKQYFESYTMDWDKDDLEDVIDDFDSFYTELENGVEEYGGDLAIEGLGLALDDEILEYRARRLCKLFEIGAPEIILHREALKLMDAMIIARFAVSQDYAFQFADTLIIRHKDTNQ